MRRDTAVIMLGLTGPLTELTPALIMEAFRKAAWKHHPDGQGEAFGPGAAADIDKLTTAKKTLLDMLSGADFACKMCGGSGKVRGRMGLVQCGPCKGTGDRTP